MRPLRLLFTLGTRESRQVKPYQAVQTKAKRQVSQFVACCFILLLMLNVPISDVFEQYINSVNK